MKPIRRPFHSCHCESRFIGAWQSHWLNSKYQNPISKQILQNVKIKVQNDRAKIKSFEFYFVILIFEFRSGLPKRDYRAAEVASGCLPSGRQRQVTFWFLLHREAKRAKEILNLLCE